MRGDKWIEMMKTDDAKKEFLIDKLKSVPFTMTQCYQGNHYKCQSFSSSTTTTMAKASSTSQYEGEHKHE